MKPELLKQLRPVLLQSLGYDDLVSIFKKAGLLPLWPYPFEERIESWERLYQALFDLKGRQFKEPQDKMREIAKTL
jgi:hypothetical protein